MRLNIAFAKPIIDVIGQKRSRFVDYKEKPKTTTSALESWLAIQILAVCTTVLTAYADIFIARVMFKQRCACLRRGKIAQLRETRRQQIKDQIRKRRIQ